MLMYVTDALDRGNVLFVTEQASGNLRNVQLVKVMVVVQLAQGKAITTIYLNNTYFLTTMIRILLGLLMLIVPYTTITAGSGKKPQWVTKGTSYLDAQRSNASYSFMVVETTGSNLVEAKKNRMLELADAIGKENNIEGQENATIINNEGGEESARIEYKGTVSNNYRTRTFYTKLVDDYWEYISYSYGNDNYRYYALYAVSTQDKEPVFDHFSSTTSYGATPVLLSIIPGVGQMYKGSTAKGICMLAGVAACSVGALFCENERSDYKNKMKEQPQFAQQYNTKANNYETARNICIGAAAAVWLYNIIDADVAKGARRIVISPARNSYWSLHPVATPNSAGLSLAYNF